MPLNAAVAELRLCADRAACMAQQRRPLFAAGLGIEDHRTQVIGELLDALDRVDPGLGDTLLHAMYPHAAAALDDVEARA
jgi:hypothetical protein